MKGNVKQRKFKKIDGKKRGEDKNKRKWLKQDIQKKHREENRTADQQRTGSQDSWTNREKKEGNRKRTRF